MFASPQSYFAHAPGSGYYVGVGCKEKDRLLAEYSRASLGFSDAVATLQRKTGTSTKPEYEALRRAADDARMKSEQARLALEEHSAIHGC